jgi:quinol monooxygenase YgiN
MICVVASISTKPGSRNELLKILEGLVPKVLAEKGCIEYAPMVDAASEFAPVRADVVTMVEKWESVTALQAHLATPHMLEFQRQTTPLEIKMNLSILEPAK